jgi:hypothetical protein
MQKWRSIVDRLVNLEHFITLQYLAVPLRTDMLCNTRYLAIQCSENPPTVESEGSATAFCLFWLQGRCFCVRLGNVLCLLWRNGSVAGIFLVVMLFEVTTSGVTNMIGSSASASPYVDITTYCQDTRPCASLFCPVGGISSMQFSVLSHISFCRSHYLFIGNNHLSSSVILAYVTIILAESNFHSISSQNNWLLPSWIT